MKRLFFLVALVATINSYAQVDSTSTTNLKTEDSSLAKKDTVTNISVNESKQNRQQVYKLKPAVDIPVTAATAGWTLYGFSQIYNKEGSSTEDILSLDKNDINGFDRGGADVYHEKAAKTSDLFFYSSMPLPFFLLFDKKINKDAGKIGMLYLEAMSVTGLLYTGASYLVDRYRPYAYNPEAPMDLRTGGGAKNSFFAGHVALVGTATFFIAKVYSDYHPESKAKWAFYTGAALATATTGYLRHRGGRHFPSDILLGATVGTLSGILVPQFHKSKLLKNERLSIMPFAGQSNGLAMVYKFK